MAPFYEPGLDDLMAEQSAAGRLRFEADLGGALGDTAAVFVCVGTPLSDAGTIDVGALEDVVSAICATATSDVLVVEKSTVPPGTGANLEKIVAAASPAAKVEIVANPEFLREGRAIEDSMAPSRILVGAESDSAHRIMATIYEPLVTRGIPYIESDVATAELAKLACNAFLALKISFINGMARVSEAAGADVVRISETMGLDPRIGASFLNAGLGYGGFCFSKDILAFSAASSGFGYDFALLDQITDLNDQALAATLARVESALSESGGDRVAILGLAFKPGTDDVRNSPALRLATELASAGRSVSGYDPMANERREDTRDGGRGR